MPTLIKNGQVLFSNGISQTDITIIDGILTKPTEQFLKGRTYKIIDANGKYIIPTFVDIHHHGANGFDCVWGGYDVENDRFIHDQTVYEEKLEQALSFCEAKGIGRLFPTTMAAPKEQLLQSLNWLHSFLDKHPQWDAFIGGINLEGSFLKLPAYAGAQNPDYFYPPSLNFIKEVQDACGHRLKIVNLPPEHGPQSWKLIEQIREMGIVIAGGHSGANFNEFSAGIDAGVGLAVHFLNGPSKSSTKPFGGGGAVEAMLQSDKVMLELIVDGWHIHPAYVRDTIARKGIDKCIAITDSMFASGLTNLENFNLGGLQGEVSTDKTYLRVAGGEDTLFGSILTPERALQNLLNWFTQPMKGFWYREHAALSFEEALLAAVQMLSGNPARLMGLDGIGELDWGKIGQILMVDIEKNGEEYQTEIELDFTDGILK